ncbi:MAG: hypothetical protein QN168_09100 [Armatimonadota bacterium]|nr:hypothetical protein [Armatimonadota bacterium]
MAAAAALAAAAAILLLPVSVVEVAHAGTGRLLWRVPVSDGDTVDLNYTNSLFNAPTTERFVVTGGLLRLVEISSTQQAVLEYLILEPPYQRRGSRVVSERRGPSFKELTIRIGQTGQQRLVFGTLEVPLYRVGTGEAVRVRMARMPRARVYLNRPQSP